MNKLSAKPPFKIRNIRLFIAFRLFFNARFYYPIFSIIFLDFGLSLSQFAILNAIWAGTIVICEVPSGALADTLGRKNLLVFAGGLMVLEMALWVFAPRSNPALLFSFLLANRILSGMAEASASGADEAIAYDSLKQEGDVSSWGHVLEMQQRFQATGFIIVMIAGAAVYDPTVVQMFTDSFGWKFSVTQETTLRLPIILTLAMAVLCLITAISIKEINSNECIEGHDCFPSIRSAFKLTFQTCRWIFETPFVLIVILTGMVFDSAVRMVITMGSQYYRLIDIPEALFGVVGSGIALMGFFVPGIARRLSERYTPLFNTGVMAAITLCGLIGMAFFVPYFGLIPALVLFSNMFFLNFFLSHYLNQATSSDKRATVLSFKGLALNLGYGGIGILYSLLLAHIRTQTLVVNPGLTGDALKNAVFISSMAWFPGYLIVALAALLLFAALKLKNNKVSSFSN